jgi:hypothetical protein
VLRPGGGLALVWNIEETREPWMQELQEGIVAQYARKAGVPNYCERPPPTAEERDREGGSGPVAALIIWGRRLWLETHIQSQRGQQRPPIPAGLALTILIPIRRPPCRLCLPMHAADLGTHKPALASPWFAELFEVPGAGPAACSAFFRWQRPMTREMVWMRISSLSFVASLADEEREAARAAVEAWADRHTALFAAPPSGAEKTPTAPFDMVTEAFVVRRRV